MKDRKTIRIDSFDRNARLNRLQLKITAYDFTGIVVIEGGGGERPDKPARVPSSIFLSDDHRQDASNMDWGWW